MPLTRRYTPEHSPGDDCTFGMDFSYILPPGVSLQPAGSRLTIFTNAQPPVAAGSDFLISAVSSQGRAIWARVSGGVEGTDYQFRWQAVDTDGNIWNRTALVLCAQTS